MSHDREAMSGRATKAIVIQVYARQTVSGLLTAPGNAKAFLVLAYGAGAGMNHPFMAAVAEGLADQEIATLRFQFPFMEQGSKLSGSSVPPTVPSI